MVFRWAVQQRAGAGTAGGRCVWQATNQVAGGRMAWQALRVCVVVKSVVEVRV